MFHSAFKGFILNEGGVLKHWILDGFPRTQAQGKMLDLHLELVIFSSLIIIILWVTDCDPFLEEPDTLFR